MVTSIPETPVQEGTILETAALPRLGVWLMPNNQLPGELENFVQSLIPSTDQLWSHAHQSIDAIPSEQRLFKTHDYTKALLHTWLAWQEEPGTPIGQALTKRYLQPDASGLLPLIAWIRRLFELNISQQL